MFDYLIVGAGYAGSVLAERLASQANRKVLICDRRNHIAGNAFDHYNDDGILVHKYGPHIFHTESKRVLDYLSQFTQWRPYEHRVLARLGDEYYPMPINRTTVNSLYGLDLETDADCAAFYETVAQHRSEIRTSEDVVVNKVGRDLYEKFIRGYTRRHWGHDPSELDASVAGRVAPRTNTDDRYFTDAYQVMPLHGYTRMFEKMLSHPNIKVMLNTDYREIIDVIPFREMIYTGPIDEYFNYRFGRLPYLTLEFRHETHDVERFLPAPVVNSSEEHVPYDRVTEFKYLTGQVHPKTSIVYEYPHPHENGDPYYPVPRPENARRYAMYKEMADQAQARGVWFVGRLATYKYYNMDQVTAQALTLFEKIMAARQVRVSTAAATASATAAPSPVLTAPTAATSGGNGTLVPVGS